MINKKGQLGGITGIVFTVIFVAILLVAGFLIMNEMQETTSLSDSQYSVTNETDATTGIWLNHTTWTLASANEPGFNSPVITALFNYTDGVDAGTILDLGNVTVTAGGVIENGTVIQYQNVSISYTYNRGEEAYIGVNDTINAFSTIPTLLGLVILIAMIGIVLAIIFSVIPGAKTSGA